RPGLEFQFAKEKEKLSVRVAADAEPGLYWLRFYDAAGATAPTPFVVGQLPETVDAEPNERPGQAQQITQPSVIVNGRLARRGDVDHFGVKLAKGQTLVARIDAQQPLESPVDCLLEIVTPAGFVSVRNEDHLGLDPRVVFVAPTDGQYFVRVFGFPATPDSTIGLAGGDAYIYRLLLTTEGFVDHAWPLAVGTATERVDLVGWNLAVTTGIVPRPTSDPRWAAIVEPQVANRLLLPIEPHLSLLADESADPTHPQAITLPVTVTGRIAAPRGKQAFRFAAKGGTTLILRVDSRELGFDLDPVLELLDAAGKSVAKVDDSAGGRDAELTFAVPADGDYVLQVCDLHRQGGPRFVYRLRATTAQPDYALSVAGEGFVVAAGGQLEIPVKVDRLLGFNQPVAIQIEGLPAGATCDLVTSPAEGDAAKEIKLVVKGGDSAGSGAIQFVGRVAGAESLVRRATAPIAGRTAKTDRCWLTVTAAAK
ncbi:MAG: PPC domain-containing protein, partial [Planctomycetaceae bacterium]|nr:PPC domain-containing protein [Planctomycetaceae bacterium]